MMITSNPGIALLAIGLEFHIKSEPFRFGFDEKELGGSAGFRERWDIEFPLDELSGQGDILPFEWISWSEKNDVALVYLGFVHHRSGYRALSAHNKKWSAVLSRVEIYGNCMEINALGACSSRYQILLGCHFVPSCYFVCHCIWEFLHFLSNVNLFLESIAVYSDVVSHAWQRMAKGTNGRITRFPVLSV
jgi:hypothetical protein